MSEPENNVVDIQKIIASLKEVNSATVERRISLLNDRAKLESLVPTLASTAGVDDSLGMLAVSVAWDEFIGEVEQYETNAIFCGVVTAAVVSVLQAFGTHLPPEDGVELKIYNTMLVRLEAKAQVLTMKSLLLEAAKCQL